MSHTYKPSPTGAANVDLELQRLQRSLNAAQPEVYLSYLHAAPAKTLAGMLVLADGTDWNPGSGAGLYRRDEANAAWVFIG